MAREFFKKRQRCRPTICSPSNVPLLRRFGTERSVRCSPARLGNPFHVPHVRRRRQLDQVETSDEIWSSSKGTAPTDLTPVDPCILLVEHVRPSDGLLRCIREIEIIHAAGPIRLHTDFDKTRVDMRLRAPASPKSLPRRSPRLN